MNKGSTLSFIELFNQVNSIHIPILQRDYAQGRLEASEIRRQFLMSIKKALVAEDLKQPLDLDFVYGNFEGDETLTFSVLDGQQRLTSLYLLHWYLATKEEKLYAFQETFVSGTNAKFTYKTRVSATEFFNALSTSNDVTITDSTQSISNQIRDKQWFFLSWQYDPTVQACLTMLDAIHDHFSQSKQSLYDRLIDINNPRIVFQYLSLESFGLSDELYIKMNARGKPLSDFENFKALLCSKLEKMPKGKEIEKKIDQEWTDIFWKISLELNQNFDELFIKFLNIMKLYNSCERVEGSFDYLEKPMQSWLNKIRRSNNYIPIDEFDISDSFNIEYIQALELVLDYFSKNIMNDVVLGILKDGIINDDYVSQVKFYAYVKFVQSTKTADAWTDKNEINLSCWMRVTENLINNHRIDEMSPFVASIKSISDLSIHCEDVYEFLVDKGMNSGFTKEQRDEESIKASLILIDHRWEPLLIKYESHIYLQGKVGFILDMASNDDGLIDKVKFEEIAKKVEVLLSDNILRSDDFLLQRALLTFGDYLVHEAGFRYGFCIPNRNTYRERSDNWLNVVKKPVFKRLVDEINDNVEMSLRQLIASANCGGWRQLIIEYPEVIKYCGKGLVHKEDDLIYLLSKSSFRGYHVELRTYVFDIVLRKMKQLNELPNEISWFHYEQVYGNFMPYIQIEIENKNIYRIAYNSKGFFALQNDQEDSEQLIPKVVSDLLIKVFPAPISSVI